MSTHLARLAIEPNGAGRRNVRTVPGPPLSQTRRPCQLTALLFGLLSLFFKLLAFLSAARASPLMGATEKVPNCQT